MSRVWLVFPLIGAIRFSTVLAFIVGVAIVTWYRRSLLVGLVVGMGWVSAFEIFFQAVGTIYGRHDLPHLFYLTFTMSGWVVGAYLVGVRPHPGLLAVWGLVFLGWIASGFQPNLFDQPGRFSVVQEVFNVATKDGLAAIFVIGVLAPFRLRARTPASSTPPVSVIKKEDPVRT